MSKEFVNGLMAYQPHEKAPDFVKANLTIFRDDLIEWLKTQPEKIKVDIKQSKSTGKWYPEVNTYKKKDWEGREEVKKRIYTERPEKNVVNADDVSVDDIPF